MLAALFSAGDMNESQIRELERHHMILRECVEELKMAEASRASLVSNLRGAIEEQVSQPIAKVNHDKNSSNILQVNASYFLSPGVKAGTSP